MSVRFTLDLARSPHLDPVPDKSGSRGCDRHGSGARFWEVAPCPVAQVYTHSWREQPKYPTKIWRSLRVDHQESGVVPSVNSTPLIARNP